MQCVIRDLDPSEQNVSTTDPDPHPCQLLLFHACCQMELCFIALEVNAARKYYRCKTGKLFYDGNRSI